MNFRQHNHISVKEISRVGYCLFLLFQLFLIPSLVFSEVQAQSSDRFGTNLLVTGDASPYSNQVEPTMTILDDGRILVGWKEADSHNGAGRRVGFSYSTDGGRTFSYNSLMNRIAGSNYQSDPWLISDSNNNAYFVWIEFNDIYLNYEPEGIGVAKTTDGGLTWDDPVNAADTPYFDDKETACIDSNGNIYIVWDQLEQDSSYETVYWDLRFTKSTDGGTTFTPTQLMKLQPFIAYIHCSPNDTLYISSVNSSGPGEDDPIDQIHFTRSSDLGTTWSNPVLVPIFQSTADIITVIDTDSDETVYIAYSAGTAENKNIYLISSDDGGNTWNPSVRVNDPVDSSNYLRMVEMYIGINDTIHIAWLDTRLGEYNIYYSYSTDGGLTFSPDERISEVGFSFNFERPGDYFCMRQDPVTGDMCIVWTDARNGINNDIYFARQGLNILIPPKWPIIVTVASLIVAVIITLSIIVARGNKRL
jgi:hypothetical protein